MDIPYEKNRISASIATFHKNVIFDSILTNNISFLSLQHV